MLYFVNKKAKEYKNDIIRVVVVDTTLMKNK